MSVGADTAWLSADDRTVREKLDEELARLAEADPFSALGLSREAGDAEIRAAFLALTKVFHPHRFARRDPELRAVANEVFLYIKKAYGRISHGEGRRRVLERLGTGRRAGGARRFDTAQTAIPAPAPATGAFERVTDKAEAPAAKRPKRRVSSARRERLRRELGPPAQDTDPRRLVQRVAQEAEEQHETFNRGRELLGRGRHAEARELFRRLAVASPSEKKYRVYMHYAWGGELAAAGQEEEARDEYERALSLDASFEPARRSLDELRATKKGKDGGFFARLFRK